MMCWHTLVFGVSWTRDDPGDTCLLVPTGVYPWSSGSSLWVSLCSAGPLLAPLTSLSSTPAKLPLWLWGVYPPHLLLVTRSMNQHLFSALLLVPELPLGSDLRPLTSLSLSVAQPPDSQILWPRWVWTSKYIFLSTHHPLSVSSIRSLWGRAKPQWFL